MTTQRYIVESLDGYGYAVLDSTVPDGDNACVGGDVNKAKAEALCAQFNAHDKGEPCDVDTCQECCSHDDRDHGICLNCEHEEDPGRAIDRAMDAVEASYERGE